MTPLVFNIFTDALHDWRASLVAIIIGAIAGFLAQLLTPGRGYGIIVTILLGIVGGWLGNILFRKYLSFFSNPLLNQIVCATAGAFILALLINLLIGNDEGDKTRWKA